MNSLSMIQIIYVNSPVDLNIYTKTKEWDFLHVSFFLLMLDFRWTDHVYVHSPLVYLSEGRRLRFQRADRLVPVRPVTTDRGTVCTLCVRVSGDLAGKEDSAAAFRHPWRHALRRRTLPYGPPIEWRRELDSQRGGGEGERERERENVFFIHSLMNHAFHFFST